MGGRTRGGRGGARGGEKKEGERRGVVGWGKIEGEEGRTYGGEGRVEGMEEDVDWERRGRLREWSE